MKQAVRCSVCNNPMLVMDPQRQAAGQKPLCSDRCIQLDRGNSAVRGTMARMAKRKGNELLVFVGIYFVVVLLVLFYVYFFLIKK